MKYWVFDGGDVVGPFTTRELFARPGFGAGSLVCEEAHSDEENYWKEARHYEEFAFNAGSVPSAAAQASQQPSAEPDDKEELYQQEMSTLLSERNPLMPNLSPATAPLNEEPKPKEMLHMPPAEPQRQRSHSPIEDYFNNIQGEDLGNILGIPDPRENSDLNLPRALENQFESQLPEKEIAAEADTQDDFTKTLEAQASPDLTVAAEQKPADIAPALQPVMAVLPSAEAVAEKADAQETAAKEPSKEDSVQEPLTLSLHSSESLKLADTAREKELTAAALVPVVAATEPPNKQAFSQMAQLPAEAEKQTALPAQENSLEGADVQELLQSAVPATPQGELSEEIKSAQTRVQHTDHFPARRLAAKPLQMQTDSGDSTTRIMAGSLKVKERPDLQEPIKDVSPAAQDSQTYKPRLNQTPEIEEYLTQRVVRPARLKRRAKVASLLLAFGVLAIAFYMNWNMQPEPNFPPEPAAKIPLVDAPSATPLTLASVSAPATPSVKATSLPRSIPIPAAPAYQPGLTERAKNIVQNYRLAGGGTIASYFDRIYKDKLAQGFSASWSAEPLHKDAYIVKYRVTKTRKEPIVYIFQVDVANGRLMGALNNVTIDLVGKIRQ